MKTEESPMPNGVDELFCPPDYYLQFEIVNHGLHPHLNGERMWVTPYPFGPDKELRDRIGCKCTMFYRVRRMITSYQCGSNVVVCTCIGRLVE